VKKFRDNGEFFPYLGKVFIILDGK
jgi:hypothetical protein